MRFLTRSQFAGVVGAVLLCAAAGAQAQQPESNDSAAPEPVIGPPQLRDFQLEPRERIVTQPQVPQPQAPQSEPAEAPPSQRSQPNRQQPQPQPEPQRSAPPAEPPVPSESQAQPAPPPARSQPLPAPAGLPEGAAQAPVPSADDPAAAESAVRSEREGGAWWPYALLLIVLGGVAFAWSRRRKDRPAEAATEEEVPAAFAEEAPKPLPRPWLDLELEAERASFTDSEWIVQFRLSVSNPTEVAAENARIDIMLFNAGKEQDKEIGAFFRTAGRESTKLHLPSIRPGGNGIIDGEVAMPLAEMRAMKLDDRTLFVPVIAVNALYQWGEGRNGQTAKSYVIGRELQQPSEKMGAFRVDQGPRVWRTVGQRAHKLARRF